MLYFLYISISVIVSFALGKQLGVELAQDIYGTPNELDEVSKALAERAGLSLITIKGMLIPNAIEFVIFEIPIAVLYLRRALDMGSQLIKVIIIVLMAFEGIRVIYGLSLYGKVTDAYNAVLHNDINSALEFVSGLEGLSYISIAMTATWFGMFVLCGTIKKVSK